MFGAALAASEGLTPFRDFFAMYGWPISVVQGAAFFIFEPTVVVLRGVSAVMLAAAAALFFMTWCAEFGRSKGYLAILLLLTTTPFTSFSYGLLPWNSDLILLAQALAMLLCGVRPNKELNAMRPISIAGIAALISIILWSRLTVGVASILLISIVLVASNQWSNLRAFWLPLIAINILPLTWLLATKSVEQFVFQFLEFPRSLFVDTRGLPAIRQIVSHVLLHLPLALLIGHKNWLAVLGRKKSSHRPAQLFLAVTVLSTITQTYLNRIDWKVWLTRFVQETTLWVFVILGVAQGLIMLRSLAISWWQKKVVTDTRHLLRLAIALGGFVQVFPVSDWYHVWWAVVPAIGLIVGEYAREPSKGWLSSIGYRALVVGSALIVLASSLAIKLSRDFVDSSSINILSGSKMLRREFEVIAPTMLLVQEIQIALGPKSVMNICGNGLYFGLGETVKLVSPFYVSWSSGARVDLSGSETASFVRGTRPIIIYCVAADYLWETDPSDFFTNFSPLSYRLVTIDFCDKPTEKPQLFVGLPNEVDVVLNTHSDLNLRVCVRKIR